MSPEISKAHLEHLEEQLLDRTRASEATYCPRCHITMKVTYRTQRTTTFRCDECGHRLSRQTLR
jgi:tRNA(Ile2) C34 agmatinyltransferase TiaS